LHYVYSAVTRNYEYFAQLRLRYLQLGNSIVFVNIVITGTST
jgi:hypothetical protein